MSTKRNNTSIRSLVSALTISAGLLAQSSVQQAKPANTAINKQEQKTSEPTADQGKNNKSDLQVAREIRRSVIKDKSLSVYGHNVKIIAQGGKVTLKGPVHSEEEKTTIATYAKNVVGEGNVTNDITVTGDGK